MKLWASLYAMIWIVFIEFLLVMTPGGSTVLMYLHVALGIVIAGLAFYNFSGIRSTRVPGRVKRISQASFNLSVAVAILGVLLVLDVGRAILLINISIYGLILFLHVVIAFAIITQAAAIAIAYDMWEDHEFVKETEPGFVPPMPQDIR